MENPCTPPQGWLGYFLEFLQYLSHFFTVRSHLRTRPRYWWDKAVQKNSRQSLTFLKSYRINGRTDTLIDFNSVLTFWVHKKTAEKNILHIFKSIFNTQDMYKSNHFLMMNKNEIIVYIEIVDIILICFMINKTRKIIFQLLIYMCKWYSVHSSLCSFMLIWFDQHKVTLFISKLQ